MTDSEDKRERIKAKVAASQERLKRGSTASAAEKRMPNLPDAYPPENYRSLAREYPGLTVGLGLGLGLLAGAFLPKRKGGLLGKRTAALAAAAAEVALTYGRQARDAAIDAEQDAAERISEATEPARRSAQRIAARTAKTVRSATNQTISEAASLFSRIRQGK